MKYSIKLRYTSLNISWWGPWWWSESNAVGDGVASPSSSSCNIEALLFSVSKEEVGSPLQGEEEKFGARRLRQETRTSEVMKKRAMHKVRRPTSGRRREAYFGRRSSHLN